MTTRSGRGGPSRASTWRRRASRSRNLASPYDPRLRPHRATHPVLRCRQEEAPRQQILLRCQLYSAWLECAEGRGTLGDPPHEAPQLPFLAAHVVRGGGPTLATRSSRAACALAVAPGLSASKTNAPDLLAGIGGGALHFR